VLAIGAMVEGSIGRPLRNCALTREALELARAGGHLRLEGVLLGNLAGSMTELGDYRQSEELAAAALVAAREIGDRVAEAAAMINIATSRLALGEPAAALADVEHAVALNQAVGDRFHEAAARIRLGDVLCALDRAGEAAAAFAQAGELYDAIGLPGARLECEARIAALELARGDLESARRRIGPVLELPTAALTAGVDTYRTGFIAWTVLDASGDARAPARLERVAGEIDAVAEQLDDDAARAHFLGIPWIHALREAHRARP